MNDTRTADALVIFGITGDLAHKMTFRSLYRLERRGLLRVPIIGAAVEDWTLEQLIDRARESITSAGEKLDEKVFKRFARRLSFVGGAAQEDFYDRLATALADHPHPAYYLEIPPALFESVIGGLSRKGLLADGQRVVVEKPFGHDLDSARALAADLHKYIEEAQLFRIDHFLAKMALREILYLRFANTMLEPVWNRNHIAAVQINMFESFGVEDRGSFYDPVGALRDVVVNHLLQVLAAAAMEPPAGGDATTLQDAKYAVLRSMRDADPAHYVRGQYVGYTKVKGVAKGSETETYTALKLEIDNWRWAGVPFFIRAGKEMSTTATEIRLIFRDPPRVPFIPAGVGEPEPAQLVFKLDPATGVQVLLDAHRADARDGRGTLALAAELASQGGEDPTPYEVLLEAALAGDASLFTRQDSVEESWRVLQPLLNHPPAVHRYKRGSAGPSAADVLTAEIGGWRGPWIDAP
ncbi:glucose-6-phosphate dehydrogenase [Conexibacter sp. DBS9H8]|uniref:glucose-6-phosphate dehydrogenase n=1 Tax=Conexibacter sp. DBS9H8 TaxID=2937801 RepID=UPI00200EAD7A|nr:glucose-6-phosphate dehydrogenase [Conexibacter sp. DBS9H8]